MIPSAFTYVRAQDVADALRLLDQGGSGAKLLAGGQSLIPMMKLRLANPSTLIDLGCIVALRAVEVANGRIALGPLATHARIADNAEIATAAPVLWDAAGVIGDPQVRNFGTIGGSSVHGDPGADYPAALLSLDARFTLTSATGSREVMADEFFVGMYESSLDASCEILTAISFDWAPSSAYVKLEHPASGYAIAGAAANLRLENGTITCARVALTGVGDIAFRATAVEAALTGRATADERAIAGACTGAAAGIAALGDTLAPSDYRLAMADVVVERAIRRALRRGER
ncbi:MAG TPA: xanthine dehydrogenase family protein subunit M [Candidatus Lustribacter sp.]